ncbi:SpoIIE family protein phosphatase [Thalassoroseus pseudoceratinae]|uniref:SpoIIE family protein phosphatase n=1 Tax=Thalassoroseus pseudoceratinae TaxID=2713176 RepID=UPI00141ED2B3|nr:GAF domain-containing SpoIIE family protein phosphatase [Thalassoroseus pseudoceratinae]
MDTSSTTREAGLMKLVELTCDLAALHHLDVILRTVTTGACAALNCDRASLFLYDNQNEEIYTRIVTELEIAEIRVPLGKGIAGWAAQQRKIVRVDDPYTDERFNPDFDRKTGYRTKNVLAAPLFSRVDGHLVGVLQLLNRDTVEFGASDEQLLTAFAAHAASALERHQLLAQAKISQELQLAIEVGRRIQSSFLPDRLPEIAGYEVAAWWEPAESVSGDYYDVLTLPDGRTGFVMADVSGHGVGPSLIMASVRAMLRVLTKTQSDPAEILNQLGPLIYPDLGDSRFITGLFLALDPRTHELSFANAGHGPVLLFRRESSTFETLDATGLPLGVIADLEYDSGEARQFTAGDILVLMTDGAWELADEENQPFGAERIEQLIREHSDRSATELLAVLREHILAHNPNTLPPDDVTILLLKRTTD